jgi:hypothetical protein
MSGLLAVRLKGDLTIPWCVVHIQADKDSGPVCGKRLECTEVERAQGGSGWKVEWREPLGEMSFPMQGDAYAYGFCPKCVATILTTLWEAGNETRTRLHPSLTG